MISNEKISNTNKLHLLLLLFSFFSVEGEIIAERIFSISYSSDLTTGLIRVNGCLQAPFFLMRFAVITTSPNFKNYHHEKASNKALF